MRKPVQTILAIADETLLGALVAKLSADPDFEVLRHTDDLQRAIRDARTYVPGFLVLDGDLMRGQVTIRGVVRACPETRVVVLGGSEDPDQLLSAIEAGASGYILKAAAIDEIVQALRSVLAGEGYVPPSLAFKLLRRKYAGPEPS